MTDRPFFRRPDETPADWYARLAAMDPVNLSCHLRQRHRIWLDMARTALRRAKNQRRQPPTELPTQSPPPVS